MKTLTLLFTTLFTIIALIIKIVFGILAFGFSLLAAAQLAEDQENGYR